ncbi:MAG: MBL fold metallo-hydrolase [Christensenellaceae bacterium]|jgi:L-ascorbate metabolism protein UlaG (beta-lactamase superfamily)|nr:MBL fold metallo-hydrolase [Christensenellaceae bacterium]
MKIWFLDNSGFAVAQGGLVLAFDYCNPRALPGKTGLEGGVINQAELDSYKTSFLLFSHSHGDHVTEEAYKLRPSAFVVSFEMPARAPGVRLRPLEEYSGFGVTVRAFGSTDLGVSFLVDAFGKRIFHAGDFNYWHWKDESTADEIAEARALYEGVMRSLLPYAGTIDLSFYPVDPRMGEDTMEGALDFAQRMRPKFSIPMHMQGNKALAARYAAEMEGRNLPARAIMARGGSFEIE